jgi:hypothetical protein
MLNPSSARKSSISLYFCTRNIYLVVLFILPIFWSISDEEEEVPVTDVAPRTSTSRTVLASDTLVEGEETSPPQQDVVTTTPPSSPRVPSPKRARVEKIVDSAPQLGSSSTLLLDDVSLSTSIFSLFYFSTPFLFFMPMFLLLCSRWTAYDQGSSPHRVPIYWVPWICRQSRR